HGRRKRSGRPPALASSAAAAQLRRTARRDARSQRRVERAERWAERDRSDRPIATQTDLQPGAMGGESRRGPTSPPKYLSVSEAQHAPAVHGGLRFAGSSAELSAARAEHACPAGPGTPEWRVFQLDGAGSGTAGGARSRRGPRPSDRTDLSPGARP